MKKFLKTTVKSRFRKLVVKNIDLDNVLANGKNLKKIIITAADESGLTFNLSDTWLCNGQEYNIKGLWWQTDKEGDLLANSAIGRVLHYYGIQKLEQLLNKEITTYPDKKHYLILVACDLNEEKLCK